MTSSQSGQKDKSSATGQQGNLGQNEGKLEQEKQAELSHMGEKSREASGAEKDKH